ncbi:nuclear transcription factor Y subunit beta-like [Limulus polyphemus]|uniref:Nuclear transcription factor Y subunit beta-like n=1 Tax=Limulus polyphemus TaxID=6850 RepID=A0ABM1RWJ9_LIMPO|nr:nuclear transcription factor Y subunit beta-like [Limulus polyphemus]XP_022235753.1 nuclear transcription factor Y subunit beta-like [Limulus polyphemus]XP_022235754.1 nuclear transcription factor Y subunit beta-like [Limulus polyphemus]
MECAENGGTLDDSYVAGGGSYIVHAEGPDGEDSLGIADDEKYGEPMREQDRFLPIANVARIMRSVIPKSGKVSTRRVT